MNYYNNPLERKIIRGVDINEQLPYAVDPSSIRFKPKIGDRKFTVDGDVLSKHMLILGGIGTGKTNVFYQIVDELSLNLSNEDVMIIFDTKGDFWDKFHYNNCYNHILLGNGDKYEDVSRVWNIFGEIMPNGVYEGKKCDIEAKEIAKELFVGRSSESQPFFVNAATDVFSKVLIDFMRTMPKNNWNNKALVDKLKRMTIDDYRDMLRKHDDMKASLSYLGDGDSDQGIGVLSEINSMVEDLFIGVFADVEGGDKKSISLRKLVREKNKRILFIEYDLALGEVLGPVYRVLIDLALKEALSRKNNEKAGNVYFIIDEFKLLPLLQHIDDGLNFGRSLGVKIIAGIQNISQLAEVYEKERAEVVAAGFMNLIAFQTLDIPSRKFVSEYFGKNQENYLYYDSFDNPVSFQRESFCVEDDDILKLKTGEAFVSINGLHKFKFAFSLFGH